MKRRRSHRRHKARRKLKSQSKESGRARRLLRFWRQTGPDLFPPKEIVHPASTAA